MSQVSVGVRTVYSGFPSLFIARQHAMHAGRDIVTAILSVRPTVRLSSVSKQMNMSSHFFHTLAGASF